MSYKYEYTYPKNKDAAGYSGPMPYMVNINTFTAGIIDSVDNRNLIKSSIQRIIGTNYGERVMQPEFGTRLRQLLFEQLDNLLIDDIKEQLFRIINEQEPRIILTNIDFDFDYDNHTINIALSFIYRRSGIEDSFNFYIR